MAGKYGVDAFRYFLMAGMTLGNDASFTEEDFIARYNSDLANDLGNMLSRVVKLTIRHFDGKVPPVGASEPEDIELISKAVQAVDAVTAAVENMKLDKGLETVMNVVRAANRYMEQTAPWTLAKQGRTERLGTVLYTAAEVLRIVSGLLYPVMPDKMSECRKPIRRRFRSDRCGASVFCGRAVPFSTCRRCSRAFRRKSPRRVPRSRKRRRNPQSSRRRKRRLFRPE